MVLDSYFVYFLNVTKFLFLLSFFFSLLSSLVIADTPYARVMTHTFFPANTHVDVSTTLPSVVHATLPMLTMTVSTPPV